MTNYRHTDGNDIAVTEANPLPVKALSGGTVDAGLLVADANLIGVEIFQDDDMLISEGARTLAQIKGSALTAGGTIAIIQALGQNIRYSPISGVNAAQDFGIQLAKGDQFFYTGNLAHITFFPELDSTTSDKCEINVAIFKQA